MRCDKCGSEHSYENCIERTQVKCCNCGGSHSPAYREFIAARQAKDIQKTKIINNLSYAETLRRLSKPQAEMEEKSSSGKGELQLQPPSIKKKKYEKHCTRNR